VVHDRRNELAGDFTVTTPPTPHLEAQLQHDIDVLQRKLLEMADLDERALARALQSFLKGDRQLAYSVILRDQDVDAFETELDRLCIEFIVRHQPAAALLRFVYSSSKIVGALERVGDYAESIARQVLLAGSLPYDVPTEKFVEIANLAIPMLHNAMRAFLEKNADLARTTLACEPRVNRCATRSTRSSWSGGKTGGSRSRPSRRWSRWPGGSSGSRTRRPTSAKRRCTSPPGSTSATGRGRDSASCSWTSRTAV
jgi:phosphate transport system protein